jgi:hypothetical protein
MSKKTIKIKSIESEGVDEIEGVDDGEGVREGERETE